MNDIPDAPSRPASRAAAILAVATTAALILMLGLATACYSLFNSFSNYDDEGYLMMQARFFDAGYALYDEVPTPYGPFYFACTSSASFAFDGLDNDKIRIISVATWTGIALAMALCVLGITGRAPLAAVAFFLAFFYLRVVAAGPGHPQEICGLLLAACVASGLAASRPRGGAAAAVACGAAAGALALTKVNVGLLSLLSLVLAATAGPGRWRGAARALAAAAAMALPFAVARTQLGTAWGLNFALIVSLSVVPLLLVGGGAGWWPSGRQCALFVASYAATALLLVAFVVARGTTPFGIVDGLILMPSRLASQFIMPARMPAFAFLGTLASIALAAAHARRDRLPSRFVRDRYEAFFSTTKLAFGAWAFAEAYACNSQALLSFGGPFVWLGLTPYPGRGRAGGPAAARAILCYLAALQPFQAYPVSGAQSFFGTALIVMVAAVCVGDVLDRLAAVPVLGHVRRAAPPLVLILVAALFARRLAASRAGYLASTPMDLPGAAWIRIDARRAADYRRLAEIVRRDADSFICTTGLNSLYLWSGQEPPCPVMIGNIVALLTHAQQQEIIDSLSRARRPCVVNHASFFPQIARTVEDNPIAQHVRREYEVADCVDGYRVMFRKDRRPASPRRQTP